MEKQKDNQIEKGNKILLKKMYNITVNPGKHNADSIYMTLPFSHGTLNRHVREETNYRITGENQ